MKSVASVMLTLAATTDAASLRSKATTRALSSTQLAAVQKIATQYDCHDASGDLVTTLQNIVVKNDAEGTRLKNQCDGFRTTYEEQWTAAKQAYDTDFPQVTVDAVSAYNTAITAKNSAYTTATNELEARFDGVAAVWQTEGLLGTRISAVKTPMTEATTAHTNAETAEGTALTNMQAAVGTIAGTEVYDGVDGTATAAKATSLGVCATLLQQRQAHISSDQALLDKMEPLLQQLNICEGTHATEATPGLLKAGYRGVQSKTRSGKTCQKWTVQSPQHHTRTESEYPDKGLGDHNYCRNPDGEPDGIWCYTTEAGTRWEYCDPLEQSNSQSLSLVEVDTRAKCALTKKSMMSLLEVGGVPEGSFQEFRARVITETTYMNTAKNTCDGAANRLYNGEKTRHTGLWNTAKTFTAGQLTTKTEATTAFNAEVAIGEARMVSATSAKTAEEGTRDTARTAATTAATTAKSTAITDGEAEVTRTKTAAKNSIDNNAEQEATACTEGKENLLAEAALVRQMTEILNGGGTDGSDLRVVGDAVDGNNVRWYVGMHIYSHKVNGCVNGHNIIKYTDKSVEECKKLCDDYGPGCKAFEYGMNYGGGGGYLARDCQLQNSANSAGCNGAHHNLDLYTKTEPAPAGDAGITGLNTMTADTDFGTVSADLSATTSNEGNTHAFTHSMPCTLFQCPATHTPKEGAVVVVSGGTATQSSDYSTRHYPANWARDGNVNTFQHTKRESNPWWQLTLAAPSKVSSVKITNRGNCCGERLDGAIVEVKTGTNTWEQCGAPLSGAVQGDIHTVACSTNEDITAVKLSIPGQAKILQVAEVDVFYTEILTGHSDAECCNE